MAHRLNNASRANRQLCRLNRAPVLAAELSSICAESSINQTPILTVALGDLLLEGTFTPLGNPSMRAPLARAVAGFYKMQRPSLTAVQIRAITFSEMTMSCIGEASTTSAGQLEAQRQLKMMLRARPPTDPEVQAVFSGCWNRLRQIPATNVFRVDDLGGLTTHIPDYAGVESINQIIFTAWSHGCHAFYPTVVRPPVAAEAWARALSIIDVEQAQTRCDLNLPENDLATLNIDYDRFTQLWATGGLPFYCAFYDAQAWVEKNTAERDIVHALFTCLAHLSKGQNKTNAWITSRFRRVQEHIVGLADLDAPVIQEFSKMHGGSKLTSEQIFGALAAAYKCLSDTPAASLCWVIEQSVASNITGALVVADIVSKMQFFPLSTIIGKIIPESEFAALVRLALHTLINKFGSLAGPTVTLKEYADIAYLAMAIHKKALRGAEKNSLMDYAGEYTQYLKLNKVDLDAMANHIQSTSAGSAAASVSLQALLRASGSSKQIIGELDGESVVFEDLGPSEVSSDDSLLPAPNDAIPISSLPTDLRRNKRYYKVTSIQAALSNMRASEDVKSASFRAIMGELATCGIQTSAYFSDILTTQYQLPYSSLTLEMRNHLKVWLGDEVETYLREHPTRSLNVSGMEGGVVELGTPMPFYHTYNPVPAPRPAAPAAAAAPAPQ